MLASSAWSRSFGSNAIINLATPSPPGRGSTQGDDSSHLEMADSAESRHSDPVRMSMKSPRSPSAPATSTTPPRNMAAGATTTSCPSALNPEFDAPGDMMDVDDSLTEEDVFGFGSFL